MSNSNYPPDQLRPDSSPDAFITIKGARVHNLKNIEVNLPREKLIVVTGPSGSGKSSLAFDIIYAEGQRRYIESLSAYARQFLAQLEKPDVELITGLSPTIAIEQKTSGYNPRSTVGTVTEVYDYLRVLFSRVSTPICWNCHRKIDASSPKRIIDFVLELEADTKIAVLAPIAMERKGTHTKEIEQLRQSGFTRILLNGETIDLSETIKLDKNKKHTLHVYIDRFKIKKNDIEFNARVGDAIGLGLNTGDGAIYLEITKQNKSELVYMSEKLACTHCDANVSYREPEPRTFSFNSPLGYCTTCEGIGIVEEEGWNEGSSQSEIPDWTVEVSCASCNGARLRKESLGFQISGKNIAELCSLSIEDLGSFFNNLKLTKRENLIVNRVIKDLSERIEFLIHVGAGYLSLNRSIQSLSGGESQRIRLATQIGSALVGVIYVLDEPSIGLHPRDHHKLIETLERLRDLGNTVIVVEHDRETIEKADYILDLGPGAGIHGGQVIASGSLQDIIDNKNSLTGAYFSGVKTIEIPAMRRTFSNERQIEIKNAHANNLKNLDVSIPIGVFTCITGVSGSGKSTLVVDTLYAAALEKIYRVEVGDLHVDQIIGLDQFDKVIDVDQRPIGRTPRSNPATYTGIFSLIRQLYSSLPQSKIRGYTPGRFSFNITGGRCEACQGAGLKRIEMHFMPDVFVQCDTCLGKRYNQETLDVKYKDKNISEILDLSIEEAQKLFALIPSLNLRLSVLNEVGLGYLKIGQSATTLSGGEAQRLKLARELCKRATGKTLYILDEPSTGLHFDDIKKLIAILHQLTDQGNTVIVIEHNLDIIKVADHIIDIGPEGGESGGYIIFQGTPEKIISHKKSHTGKFLKPYLT